MVNVLIELTKLVYGIYTEKVDRMVLNSIPFLIFT